MYMVLNKILTKASLSIVDLAAGFLIEAHPEWNARAWSNREIRKYGCLYNGHILNVSAWKDSDKEGGSYRDHFPNALSYRVSNTKEEYGASGYSNELELDLSKPLSPGLPTFDLVFAHTVLEHVYDLNTALNDLAALSHDSIMLVVPFVQCLHWREGEYCDYWRYSPFALQRSFEDRGFMTLYISWNQETPLMNSYIFFVASRKPELYSGCYPVNWHPVFEKHAPGQSLHNILWPRIEIVTSMRKLTMFLGRLLANPQRGGESKHD